MVIHVYSGITSRFYTIADAIELLRKSGKDEELIILWPIVKDCQIDIKEVLDEIKVHGIKVSFVSFRTSRKRIREINIRKSLGRSLAAFCYNLYAMIYNYIFDNETKMINRYAGGAIFDYNPPLEIGWSGARYEDYTYQKWKEVEKRVKTDTDIYVHAYGGMIYEKDTVRDFRSFRFKKEYLDEVKKILGRYESSQLVGVHIRRTDHNVCIKKSPLHLFLEKMDEITADEPDTHFFLATDDKETEKKLYEIYGDRIVTQDKVWGRDSKEGMKCGIIDSLCLSSCRMIIGSYSSGFSKFSAEYGKIRLMEMLEENL